jgi:hypothetical protein
LGSIPKQVGRIARRLAAPCAVALSVATLLTTAACATHHYMGISMMPGEASPAVQALAQRARAGDKQAQFDLGLRFEEGDGVPQDVGRAIKLYRQAASDGGGTRMMYVPVNGAVTATPVSIGAKGDGRLQARERLKLISSGGHRKVEIPSISQIKRDMDLEYYVPGRHLAEVLVGIRNCALSSAVIASFVQKGWQLIRCDRRYAFFLPKSLFLEKKTGVEFEQPEYIAIANDGYRTNDFKAVQAAFHSSLPNNGNSIEEKLKRKLARYYNISRNPNELIYGGIYLPDGKPLGSAYIGTSIYNSCEFSRHDALVPQSYCRRMVKDHLVKYYNHSYDFEKNQKVMDQLELMIGGGNG